MRILLTNHFPLEGSGSGVYTKALARSLMKKGHDVRIVVPENEMITKSELDIRPVYFNGITDDALPFNFPCFTTHPRSFQTFYDLSDDEYRQYRDVFSEVLSEEIKSFRPDIIHSGHIWTIPAVCADHSVPIVITAHGTELNNYYRDERYQKDALKAFDAAGEIVVISDDNEALIRDIFGRGKGTVIHNGYDPGVFYKADLDRDNVLREFGIAGDYDNVVVFVGKFAEFKGIDTLVRAAALYEDGKTLTLLAGDGLLRGEMEELKGSLGLKDLYFLGNRTPDEVCRLFNIADLSAVPSRKEPFGLVVIEAMACGCPVAGSDTGGIPEIIQEDTGCIFRQDDHEALADAVKRILEGNDFDRDMISKYARDNYSTDIYVEKMLDIYERIR